jgi:trans-2,3-dihydro-3-hydroxyanthranilate isomerase
MFDGSEVRQAMSKRRYFVYDVFADTVLSGNPLAVVLDAEGLDDKAMLRIAGEFNLSETTFVTAPENPRHRAGVRIFTPMHELPFAGHPTVGTAVALTEADGEGTGIFVLEEKVGPVRCAVKRGGGVAYAEFDLPRLPERMEFSAGREAVAAALGIGHHEIGFENHVVSQWTAGVPYILVPVHDLKVAARARLDPIAWSERTGPAEAHSPGAYVYCRETVQHDCAFHARMFAAHLGIVEDPATGSAAAAFAGAIVHFDEPVEGPSRYWIEQGMEMGRPSRIRLELDIEEAAIAAARIGGHAVKVAEGTIEV